MSIQDLIQLINTQLPDNNQQLITEAILRGVLENMVNTLSSELRVFNINSSQVTDNGDGTYTITVTNPLDDALAIDEKLNIYEYNGTNWVAKVVDIILSATGDDGVEIDDSDPNSIVVKLTQATLDSLALAESAVQPGGDVSDLNNDVGYISKSDIIRNGAYDYPDWWDNDKYPIYINSYKASIDYNIESEFDLSSYTPFYISPSGNNSNDGLSESTPFATLNYAISQGAVLVYMLPGIYRRGTFITSTTSISQDLIIVGVGRVVTTEAENNSALSWSLEDGTTYKCTRSNTLKVIDASIFDEYGYEMQLLKADTLNDCKSTQGSWYTDGTTVYVNLKDGRPPDSNVLVCLTQSASILSDNFRVYLKNIIIRSNTIVLAGNTSGSVFEIYLDNISFYKIAATGNNISLNNFKKCIVHNCKSMFSGTDALNYHNTQGVADSFVMEINVDACYPGVSGSNSSQCSSAHEGINIIRINSNYSSGLPQVIADVNSGTKSILIGCSIDADFINTVYSLDLVQGDVYGCYIFGDKNIRESGGVTPLYVRNSIVQSNKTTGNVVFT